MHRPVQSTLVYCRAVQTGRTWLSMTKQRLNLCSVTGGYAESCALKLWVSLWLKSSLPLPGFLISFPTRKLNHSYTLLFQQRYDGKWSWRKYLKKNCLTHTQTHTHLPKRPSHAVLSRSPLLSQFFRLCVCSLCLWHSPVFEKPPSRRTLPSLCALCVFMQPCTLVSPCAVRLSSSFDKLTCKGGLFTGLRVGHVWPPGTQALASLRICKIILILRAWSFAMCWGFLLAFTRTHLREFEPVGLWFWHIWE